MPTIIGHLVVTYIIYTKLALKATEIVPKLLEEAHSTSISP